MDRSVFSPLAALILALGIAISGISISLSIKYFRNFDRYVEVKGLAERNVIADQATWQIGFSASGNNLKDIYSSIDKQQHFIIDFLLQHGLQEAEINKRPISIIDNYANSYGGSNAKLSQYSANAGISVTTKSVNRIIEAVQATNQLVESGVVLSNNDVAYLYTSLNKIKAAMLNDALVNAKVAANQFALNSSSSLGKIKSASQGLFTISALDSVSNDNSSINKKVRVVTTVQFFLK